MSRAALIAEATAAVMGPILKDYQAGRISQEKFQELVSRRQSLIAEYMRERTAAASRTAVCSECGRAATTRMANADYCDEHRQNHRLSAPPRFGSAA